MLFPDVSPAEIFERQGRKGRPAKAAKASAALAAREALGLENASRVLFLDVETTGLSWFYDEITLVGWARDGVYRVYVAGQDPSDLLADLSEAGTLVTFNGTLFDLKFLKKTFGEIPFRRFISISGTCQRGPDCRAGKSRLRLSSVLPPVKA